MIYLDHNATTPMAPAVVEAMLPYFHDRAGNPMAVHGAGRTARHGVDTARRQVAALVGAHESQVIFTSSGSEANNLALHGLAAHHGFKGHIITTMVEHPSVLMMVMALEQQGLALTLAGVDEQGVVDWKEIRDALRDDTIVVSMMHANNETGVIQPIAEVAALCQERGIPFHCDAAQSAGKIPLPRTLEAHELLTLSAHKLGGPKGVGALLVGKGLTLSPMLLGERQERGRRAGMENVPGIVGFGMAATLAGSALADESNRLCSLRDYLEAHLLELAPEGVIFGGHCPRLPNTTAIGLPGLDGETLVMNLDLAGFAISSGALCASGRQDPSHVLRAMGVPATLIHGAIRISLGPESDMAGVDRFIKAFGKCLTRLRAMATPLQ